MSERERSGVEYDSPEGEPSEDASSAIGPLPDSTFPSTIDLPAHAGTGTAGGGGGGGDSLSTMDSAAIGAVTDDPPEVMGKVPNGSRSTPTTTTTTGLREVFTADDGVVVAEAGDEDESEDGDDEGEYGDDGEGERDEDDEDEDEDDEEEEEDDDDEEEEPVLKYSKIEGAAADILEKDAASAIAVGATYFAVGTHNGLVHLFTLRGTLLKSYRPHSASITDICISFGTPDTSTSRPSSTSYPSTSTSTSTSPSNRPSSPHPSSSNTAPTTTSDSTDLIPDTIATTSLDGHAILHTLRTGTTTGHNFKRPLRSIALSPTFSTSPSKAYVCGGMAGDLVLTQRAPSLTQALGQSLGLGNLGNLGGLGGFESILTFGLSGNANSNANASANASANAHAEASGPQTQKVLSTGDGPIWTIRWAGDIIAWAVDAGVRLYSVSKGEKIAFVERARESPRGDLFACSLTWLTGAGSSAMRRGDYEELLIGWADLVKVVRVSSRPKVGPGAGVGGVGAGAGGGGVGSTEKPSGSGTAGAAVPQAGMETVVEVTKVLRLDCMIAGAAYWPFLQDPGEKEGVEAIPSTTTATTLVAPTAATTAPISNITTTANNTTNADADAQHPGHRSSFTKPKPAHNSATATAAAAQAPASQTTFLLLTYLPTKAMLSAESNADQRRQPSNPPELRIVTSEGEERSRDVLAMRGSERWGCGDYRIVESFPPPPQPQPQPSAFPTSSSSGGAREKEKEKGRVRGKRVEGLRERDHGGWLVLSPKGVVVVKKRDRRDRVMWLVERERYEEALDEMEKMEMEGDYVKLAAGSGSSNDPDPQLKVMSKEEIGMMYLDHLFKLKQYEKAAKLCPKVLGGNAKAWEDWIFQFAHVEELSVLVPYVPFKTPRLSKIAYGIILAYYLSHDTPALSQAIKDWPSEIYDIPSLINAIPQPPPTQILMECIADLYIKNRQPGKALSYFLRLRRPNVFQLIRDNNLFTDVQDQALLLVEFDQELMTQRENQKSIQPEPQPKSTFTSTGVVPPTSPTPSGTSGVLSVLRAGMNAAISTGRIGSPVKPTFTSASTTPRPRPALGAPSSTSYWTSGPDNDSLAARRKARGEAIPLLVENSHSIPIRKVVSQLEGQPYFLYLYLDALFEKDPELSADFLERQVGLYAEYAPGRVIRLLQTAQNLQIDVRLEKIYKICEEKDMVPEMVWTRSRMGDNKGALYLIIDRLGDVNRAIDFAKERKDDDLWEDFLRYSETRPNFIKGLLENVSTEIDPIRIIRRIRNGLEIPGLKESLIKILQDFNLQTSLMEGCGTVLNSDCTDLSAKLQRAQVGGFSGNAASPCPICQKPIQQAHQDLILVFLCGHMVHAHCTSGGDRLPKQMESSLMGTGLGAERDLGAKIAYAEMVKRGLDQGCPVHQKLEQGDSSTLSPPPMATHHSHTRRHR